MSDTALYTDLSRFYDLMCANINYQEQSRHAGRLHRLMGAGGNDYLDLACGTGPHVEEFIAMGYTATGLDLNAPMLNMAARRCPSATFSLQDMSEFNFDQRFDLITCFLYSMHYCYPTEKFQAAATRVYTALNPGGVFCFDAVDKNTIANDQGVSHEQAQGDALLQFQSRWFYKGDGDLLDLFLCIHKKNDAQQESWQDHHKMLALDINSMQKILIDIGFDVTVMKRSFDKIEVWDGTEGNVILVGTKAVA
jgi:ubiquinone/menaquinone biosynthesis C-methylase UbiE